MVLTASEQADATWVTSVLAGSDDLRTGRVHTVTYEPIAGTHSHLTRLQLQYTPDATGALPPSLVLKRFAGRRFGPSEVHYYTRDYADLPDAAVPRCYDAQYQPDPPCYHILMADLSPTHQNNWDTDPTLDYGVAVAHALAALHARWWGRDRLQHMGAPVPGKADVARYLVPPRQGLEPMLACLTTDPERGWIPALRDVFDRHPEALLARVQQPGGWTLVHGDLNPGNILSPRAGTGTTYLVDRQPFTWSLTVWLGVADLAGLMVPWWEPEPRRAYELPVLRAYHTALAVRGVTDYLWVQLLRDYRLCTVEAIYTAATWCAREPERTTMAWVWRPKLARGVTALVDLHVHDLWAT